jgi:hypothetical protein
VGDNPVDPFVTLAELMTTHLIEPVWNDVCTPDYPTRLVLIPCDEVFQLPLHVAFEPGSKWPLAASLPLCFSVSATAHVSRARHLLGTQFIEPDDDLCVLAQLDDRVSGRELKDLDWRARAPPGCLAASASTGPRPPGRICRGSWNRDRSCSSTAATASTKRH